MSPKYQVVEVTIDAKGLDEDQRKALQDDLVKAVNEAIQTAVLAAASAFGALPPPTELDAIKAALKKEVDKSGC
ncbi:YbaB/EbfC family nucleoid-associated protein [Cupriavidus sp. RAF12]